MGGREGCRGGAAGVVSRGSAGAGDRVGSARRGSVGDVRGNRWAVGAEPSLSHHGGYGIKAHEGGHHTATHARHGARGKPHSNARTTPTM